MDAAALQFEDASFETVTFFYSLMFMDAGTQQKAIQEAWRVLKPDGELHVWDADIPSAFPDPFLVHLEIQIGKETVRTSYGIVKEGSQDAAGIIRLAERCGFCLKTAQKNEGQFYLRLSKV